MGLFGSRKKSGATIKRSSPRARVEPKFNERHRAERQQRIEQEERETRAAVQKREERFKEQQKKEEQQRRQQKVEAKRATKTEGSPLPWGSWGLKAMPAVAVLLVLSLVIAGWKLLDHVGSVPVSRVVFTGNLKHVDREAMVAKVQPLLAGAGFMTVDIEMIRASLREIPWVASASVARSWPDQLVIAVVEQDPIARWGSDGLLSRSGEVFRPQPLMQLGELPALFGPDAVAKEVVSHYAELSDLLGAQGLKLASLGTDERGSWRAELQGGVVLRLGSGDLLKKMQRFLRIYRGDLAAQFARVAYIDLRYSNGLAVGWKSGLSQSDFREGQNSEEDGQLKFRVNERGVAAHG
jgi:cell division protein FtsQ